MEALTYFDAYAVLGRTLRWQPGQPETAEQLLAAMDHYGIHEALVVDTLSAATDPLAGNSRIIERTAGHPRLHPAWATLMSGSREMPPPAELVAQMREHGVGALFLFYGQFDISLDDWGIDDLCGELAQARVPLFLCPGTVRQSGRIDMTDWWNVVRICHAFPELPVVVTEHRIYARQRSVYQALDECRNLHVDLSAMWLHKRVEFICRHFGAERLVWSSRLPDLDPAAPLMQLNYSDISEDELALIAGGNLRRLLSWNRPAEPAPVDFPEPIDSLHRKARERISLAGESFHDCHGHIGWRSDRHVVEATPEGIVAELDRCGIRTICVFSFAGTMVDEVFGNDRLYGVVRAYPDRFIAFSLVNPWRGEEEILRELQRNYDRGFRGVKLVTDYQEYPADGPAVATACRFADEHGLFILNHSWGPEPVMRKLCTTYPNACFLTGHTTLAYVDLAREVGNLYICTCPVHRWGDVERHVEAYGADRLLFGSDLMDLPIAWGLGPIFYARIPEGDKRKILGENLLQIMDRYNVRPLGGEG